MDPDDFVERHGKEPERIPVSEVLFFRKRDPSDIIERPYILRADMRVGETFFVKTNLL
jgi:hypothetical protein